MIIKTWSGSKFNILQFVFMGQVCKRFAKPCDFFATTFPHAQMTPFEMTNEIRAKKLVLSFDGLYESARIVVYVFLAATHHVVIMVQWQVKCLHQRCHWRQPAEFILATGAWACYWRKGKKLAHREKYKFSHFCRLHYRTYVSEKYLKWIPNSTKYDPNGLTNIIPVASKIRVWRRYYLTKWCFSLPANVYLTWPQRLSFAYSIAGA